MKKTLLIAAASFIVVMNIACESQGSDEDYVPTPAMTASPETAADSQAAMPSGMQTLPPVLPQVPAGTLSARPAVNPAHGLPHHDCSIEVGAPLPPVNGAAGAVQGPTMPGALSSAPAGVRLNPEHGKPGHRCEIAVGAPLS